MDAVRIAKQGSGGREKFTVHWLRPADQGLTVCGKKLAELTSPELVQLEKLPPVEGCLACERALDGYTTAAPKGGRSGVTLNPSLGRAKLNTPSVRGRQLHRWS